MRHVILHNFQTEDIVRVQDVFEEAGTAFLVLDAVDGQTLRAAVETTGPFSPDEGLRLARRLGGILRTLHARQVLHRDLKPENVMLRPSGAPVLIDFGAAVSDMLPAHSRTLTLTHGFAPLEQYGLTGASGAPTDLYGLSATLYFAMTGVVPPSPINRLQGDLTLEELVRIEPASLRQAVQAGLELRAADRPLSAEAFLTLLDGSSATAQQVPLSGPVTTEPEATEPALSAPWSARLLIHLACDRGAVPDLVGGAALEGALREALTLLADHREALEDAYGDLQAAPQALADELVQEVMALAASTQFRQALQLEVAQGYHAAVDAQPPVPGAPYREHVFDPPVDPNLLQKKPSDLADMLASVVATEGPVHLQEAFRRVATAHGVSKMGSRISDTLNQALELAVQGDQILRRGEFLWPPKMTISPVRNRAQQASRIADHVCDEEIAEAACVIQRQFPGAPQQEQAVQTARLLGFSRLTEGTRQRIMGLMPENV